MEFISILNDVLGPVMRGPSSSHTAGSYHIGRLVRSLVGDDPASGVFTFDPNGSYAATFRQQGVDLALAAGLLGWPITDARFPRALALAPRLGLRLGFKVARLDRPDHPNTVRIELTSKAGSKLGATAKSVGGGMVFVTEVDGWPVRLDGKGHDLMVLAPRRSARAVEAVLASDIGPAAKPAHVEKGGEVFLSVTRPAPLSCEARARLDRVEGVLRIWSVPALFHVQRGEALFTSGAEIVRLARRRHWSLGRAALAYEAELLGLDGKAVLSEVLSRYEVMADSVRQGLAGRGVRMKLLKPSAGRICRAEAGGALPGGGLHARAAARAMAALHISNSGGVVCAAPTGGSAGVLPGVVITLAEEKGLKGERLALALLAASAVGLVVARRATFAAEVAGCQVEIGVAGAMAAAAVVEASGGSAAQASDAAAVSLQNTMGSVCDLVQSMCEIPCHTRNAIAASSAFVCADLVIGGYKNPIPLDETIDAAYAAGRMLPAELRCTARGGLAVTPSALALRPKKRAKPAA